MSYRLAELYVSSDRFVFPGTKGTVDNLTLETRPSGLPALVADLGIPVKYIVTGEIGTCVPGNCP